MVPKKSFMKLMLLLTVFSLLLLSLPAAAQENKTDPTGPGTGATPASYRVYEPITKIDLGVKKLTLDPGETYTFKVSYEPADPFFYTLKYSVTNESVISVDPSTNKVTALAPGNARILAESLDGQSYAVCDVTVNGSVSKDGSAMKSGSAMVSISEADRSKITAKTVLRHMDFVENAAFSTSSYAAAQKQEYMVTADVVPGTVIAESKRAQSLGMSKYEPLENLNMVNLIGTLEQILAFTSDNPDLIEVFELDNYFLSEPLEDLESDGSAAKAITLQSNVESVTNVSTAHNLGYKGNGYAVAVLDTGLNSSHTEFGGRVIAQHCFTTNHKFSDTDRYEAACTCSNGNGTTESNSANPCTYSDLRHHYNHGSHVAGIAAGKGGIAPSANIVAVQIFSDYIWWCTQSDINNGYFWKNQNNKAMCYSNTIIYQNKLSAYNWLVTTQNSLKNNGRTPIVAVNMSYGGSTGYSSTCDYDSNNGYQEYNAFNSLVNAGMVPVVSSGNNGFDGKVTSPSCKSNAFRVGSLYDGSSLQIAPYSNHSNMVDILAPGTHIVSSFLASESGSNTSCPDATHCYGKYSGTSMAAPMVTGAFAVLKQAYPSMSVSQLESKVKSMTTKTANYRLAGSVWSSRLTNPAKSFSYSKPVLNFRNIKPAIPFTLEDSRIRGKNGEILIVIPYNSKMTNPSTGSYRISWALYNMDKKAYVSSSNVNIKMRLDANGKNIIFSMTGSGVTNAQVYRVHLWKWEMYNGTYTESEELIKYAMPIPNVYGATVVAGNRTMVINTRHREPSDGTRYMINDGNTNVEIAYKKGTKNNTSWTYSSLTNGKLYYALAVPYRVYNGQTLWGPNQNRIYFIPMTAPTNGDVWFYNSSQAEVSVDYDSNANGIRVLYRVKGGELKNGCESTGTYCTVKNLNRNNAYEFYAMKYKVANGKKYYSMGILIPYNTSSSGLTAPQSNPTVAMANSGSTTFTIKLSSNADGISVLYRIAEGSAFYQACEDYGNSCNTTLNTKSRYTFYIMQWRWSNGYKVYSPGIVARDFSSAKSVDTERLYTKFELADNSLTEAVANSMSGYVSEEELLMVEANKVMGLGMGVDEYLASLNEPAAKAIGEVEDRDLYFDIDGLEANTHEANADASLITDSEDVYGIDYSIDFYRLDDNRVNGPVPSFQH